MFIYESLTFHAVETLKKNKINLHSQVKILSKKVAIIFFLNKFEWNKLVSRNRQASFVVLCRLSVYESCFQIKLWSHTDVNSSVWGLRELIISSMAEAWPFTLTSVSLFNNLSFLSHLLGTKTLSYAEGHCWRIYAFMTLVLSSPVCAVCCTGL